MVKFYLVGGFVRDKLLGVKSKDRDYTCEAPSYEAMRQAILDRGGSIFLETPQYFTIRALVPEFGASDFVLARKEGAYSDGRRPDKVEAGTLVDDLSRRDFTVNAMALDEQGKLIDPFGGELDLKANLLKCVGSPYVRFNEDSLRLLRAIRFHITKGFDFHWGVSECLRDEKVVSKLKNVSGERIREELLRCFKFDTKKTLDVLMNKFPLLMNCFPDGMWLMPTMKE